MKWEGGMRILSAVALVVCLVGGCSSLPDVQYSYYFTKARLSVTVTQTLDCSADKKRLVVLHTPVVTPTYFADVARGPRYIRIKDVEGAFAPFADSNMSFGFYDDGRLKTINQSTTGQGEAVIKSVVAIATALGGAAAQVSDKPLDVCDKLQNWAKDKPVTLTYTGAFDPGENLKSTLPLRPAKGSEDVYANLESDLPVLGIQFGPANASGSRVVNNIETAEYVPLTLQSTSNVEVNITASGASIWTASIPVPLADTYELPILKSAFFGKQSFSLSLSEAGAITSIEYAKNTGTTGALSAVSSITAAETPAAKAAELEAQADLIAQQQRLARCQTDPATCE
jgi:hypothetical protein